MTCVVYAISITKLYNEKCAIIDIIDDNEIKVSVDIFKFNNVHK